MEQKIKFQKLTPTNEVELDVYKDAFGYIFENDDIKNVAISGPYSAGKSSVLESYKKNNCDKQFLHVSLAHFKEELSNEKLESESVLEAKILNQLIQQIEPDKIPQTHFRVKHEISDKKCVCVTAVIMVLFLCLLGVIYFNKWKNWVDVLSDSSFKKVLGLTAFPYLRLIYALIALTIIAIGVFKLIKTQRSKGIFRKLSFQGNEIEICAEDNESYFDKYLNEVLYLFEHADVDVVVFEDIDRFDTVKIFERLREINILINIRLQKKSKIESGKNAPIIRFFYLLRDDIFISKERTKFFDFIIPIIPVVDSSNAYNQFKKYMVDGGVFSLFEERFLRGISLYIDDLRILKNIYNEFMIYYNRLNHIELNPDRMLAIITYKNIFPKDFADLQLNKGYIWALFDNKQNYIDDEQSNINIKCEELRERIQRCQKEHLQHKNEVDQLIDPLIANNRYYPQIQREYQMEKELRKQAIADRESGQVEELQKELEALQRKGKELVEKPLSQIITRENEEQIFKLSIKDELGTLICFEDVKGNEYFPLLKFLLRDGYLDETYNDYMSYFYANSLTRNDKMFLRSVTDKKTKGYQYSLDNINLVLQNLTETDFSQEETQNFDLFEKLLCCNDYESFLLRFIEQLKTKKQFGFIAEFFDTNRSRDIFIKKICMYWKEFLCEAIEYKKLGHGRVKEIITYAMTFLDEESLRQTNIDGKLGVYISAQDDFLNIVNPMTDRLIVSFEVLGIQFKSIDYEISNEELLEAVYAKSMYEFNLANIYMFMERKVGVSVNAFTKKHILSILQENQGTILYAYVKDNKSAFMKMYLNEEVDTYTDTIEVILDILNHEDIEIEDKKRYISKLGLSVFSISEVKNQELQMELLSRKLMEYSFENILYCFENFGLNKELVDFINFKQCKLNFAMDDVTEQQKKALGQKVLHNKEISDERYTEILCGIGYQVEQMDVADISESKMRLLIKTRIFAMNKTLLAFVRNNYDNLVMYYVEKNLQEYVKTAKGENARSEEVIKILDWPVDVAIKKELLAEVKTPISIKDKQYEDEVLIVILKRNLAQEDLVYLFKNYSQYTEPVQAEILTVAKTQTMVLEKQVSDVNIKLLFDFLGMSNVVKATKQSVFRLAINRFTIEQCKAVLESMGYSNIAKLLVKNSKPKITNTADNKLILDILKNAGFIVTYVLDEEHKCYRVTRNRRKKEELPTKLL